MKRTLVLFLRTPRLGGVKRRLAAQVGARAALRFHRLTAERLIRRVGRERRWRTMLAVTAGSWRWPRGLPRVVQRGAGLGARMAHAIGAAPPGPVVLVGSDIPDIQAAHIARAFRALGTANAVFGPAVDGGYWLVGLRDRGLARRLFRDVRWSSEHALADCLANLPPRHRVALVDRLADVDDAAALRRCRTRLTRR